MPESEQREVRRTLWFTLLSELQGKLSLQHRKSFVFSIIFLKLSDQQVKAESSLETKVHIIVFINNGRWNLKLIKQGFDICSRFLLLYFLRCVNNREETNVIKVNKQGQYRWLIELLIVHGNRRNNFSLMNWKVLVSLSDIKRQFPIDLLPFLVSLMQFNAPMFSMECERLVSNGTSKKETLKLNTNWQQRIFKACPNGFCCFTKKKPAKSNKQKLFSLGCQSDADFYCLLGHRHECSVACAILWIEMLLSIQA